nr:reverse transcriptase domain-containing protein [Tanacetum cinerariifolium]
MRNSNLSPDGRPEETGIKDLFGGEVSTMMSPRGSIVASFENVKSFFAVHTPPDHLIRADLKQKGVVSKIREDERGILLKKVSHRSRNFGKILDESSVKTGVTEKTPNTFDSSGMRTTPKSSNREIPFSLVYSLEAVILIEISIETRRIQDFDPKKNEKRRREDLDILEEKKEIASIKEAHYKHKLEGYYNKCVRPTTFKTCTYVLRLNSLCKAEFQGKMGPTWEGPYIVKKAYGDGAYKLKTLSGSPIDQTWNGSNLYKFYI